VQLVIWLGLWLHAVNSLQLHQSQGDAAGAGERRETITVFTYWKYPSGAPLYALTDVESWRLHLPTDANIVLLNDTNVLSYIPDMPSEYFRMPNDGAKADLVRYAALYHHGGIYLDTDYLAARPLSSLISRIKPLDFVSYEAEGGLEACLKGEYQQGFLAARQGSGVLKRIWTQQKEAMARVCDPPKNTSFIQAEALAARREQEPCCPPDQKEACNIPDRAVGTDIAGSVVKASFRHAPSQMLCLGGEESFAPKHLSYMMERNSGLDRALALWHEVAEVAPLDRYIYHLFGDATGLAKLNETDLFNESTLRGHLLQWSLNNSEVEARSQERDLEARLMLTPEAARAERAEMVNVRRMSGLPVHSPCNVTAPRSPEEKILAEAVKDVCTSGPRHMMEAWIAPGWEENYKRIYEKSNWVQEAFVNYLAAKPESRYAWEAGELILSVHNFSTRPIVLIDYRGEELPPSWTPANFPRLVVLQAHALKPGISFNFNKLRAMMLAQVRTGIQLDADQFVYRGIDNMFKRTAEEVTQEYPYPILPVHWMSRDPNEGKHAYDMYDFRCPRCPKRTLRWSHAHPTWTYLALPFIGQLLADQVDDKDEIFGYHVRVGEDEDSFNVGLWAVGAWKQWCKFDVPATEVFTKFINDDREGLKGCCGFEDPEWYPAGIPLVFYTAHGCTNPMESREMMWRLEEERKKLPAPFFYNGTFYNNSADLRGALIEYGGNGKAACII